MCVIVVSEFADEGTQGRVSGEKLSFAGFEFPDSAVGLAELVIQCDEGGCCWGHGIPLNRLWAFGFDGVRSHCGAGWVRSAM